MGWDAVEGIKMNIRDAIKLGIIADYRVYYMRWLPLLRAWKPSTVQGSKELRKSGNHQGALRGKAHEGEGAPVHQVLRVEPTVPRRQTGVRSSVRGTPVEVVVRIVSETEREAEEKR